MGAGEELRILDLTWERKKRREMRQVMKSKENLCGKRMKADAALFCITRKDVGFENRGRK